MPMLAYGSKLKMLPDISELNLTIYHNASCFTLYLLERGDSGHGEKALEVKNKLIGGGGDVPDR
jgi:hypothetical protein